MKYMMIFMKKKQSWKNFRFLFDKIWESAWQNKTDQKIAKESWLSADKCV